MAAPCILHPNAAKPHTNGDCMVQKAQLKQTSAAFGGRQAALMSMHDSSSSSQWQADLSSSAVSHPGAMGGV